MVKANYKKVLTLKYGGLGSEWIRYSSSHSVSVNA